MAFLELNGYLIAIDIVDMSYATWPTAGSKCALIPFKPEWF
jgi:hypothetical protein